MATVTLAVFFIAGAITGVTLLVSLAIRREDRLSAPGDRRAASGARMLVPFWQRALPEGDAVALRAMR